MADDGALIACALLTETLCEEGLIDRDLLIQRALGLAHAERLPGPAREAMSRYAIALGERRYARLYPRVRSGRPTS